jgi:DNA polymerase type B, organellar and viral
MDGRPGSLGVHVSASRREHLKTKGHGPTPEEHDIFVRAHTRARTKDSWDRRPSPKWPTHCLIFDTETTLDPAQKLNFGAYRLCRRIGSKYVCVEEGIFHKDDLSEKEQKLLNRYRDNPPTLAAIEHFPARTELRLMSRSSFVSRVFWKAIKKGELIVSFNSPFDLSRLAVWSHQGEKGSDWSLALASLWKNPKTGRVAPNPQKPRIIIDAQSSKMAFIKIGSIFKKEEWPKEGRFLDMRTLGWALRNRSFNLNGACGAFKVKGKKDFTPTGRISSEEIEYCREDVAATHRVLNAMMEEFNRNPIYLHPDKSYSPASIAKAYLKAMGIKQPKKHFRVSNKILGIAMQSYYGGRAECRIRRTPVPVIHTDFTSQYPTVNALLGNWKVLTSSSIRFVDHTTSARRLLSKATLNETFEKAFWKQISFFALVKPKDDILPVRTVYDSGHSKRTQNIGINYLSSGTPIWYAGPDLVAAKILTGKAPRIIKAIQMVRGNTQRNLAATNLGGMVEIRPAEQDFYRKVIEQRVSHKKTNKGLADFLKVLANSGSYGLFVEVNIDKKRTETTIDYFSGEESGRVASSYVEKPGAWYFPPLASLITSGGRLLLAMLEKSVQERDGGYLFCDTDSLCIVGSEKGGFVECLGGPVTRKKKHGIKVLSLNEVKNIARRFGKLNPYDPSLVPEILKIEDVNFLGSNPSQRFRQLFGYAISAKRYALYSRVENDIHIEKASGHGLGYLLAPTKRKKQEEDEETPQWVLEAWEFLLRRALKLPLKDPNWLDLPTMMRMVVTTPNVLKQRRPEWLGPFNFFLFPMLSEAFGGYPQGYDKSNFVFITPYESDRRKWSSLSGINLIDGESYQIAMQPTVNQDKVIPDSFRILLRKYLGKAETKSLAPDGTPCSGVTCGLLRRSRITAGKLVPVGKETDRRWEQGEDPSMVDSDIYIYEKQTRLVIADPSERKKFKALGWRRLAREANLSPTSVGKAIKGKGVWPQTLSIIRQTAARLVSES